jgi:hypothetical protein
LGFASVIQFAVAIATVANRNRSQQETVMKKQNITNANNGAHSEPETETNTNLENAAEAHADNVIDITQGPAPRQPNFLTRGYRLATRRVKRAAGATIRGTKRVATSPGTYKAIGRGILKVLTIAALGFVAGAAGEVGSKYAGREMKRRSA